MRVYARMIVSTSESDEAGGVGGWGWGVREGIGKSGKGNGGENAQ